MKSDSNHHSAVDQPSDFGKLREEQAKTILANVFRSPVYPMGVIVAGDLNEPRDGLALTFLKERGLKSAYENVDA